VPGAPEALHIVAARPALLPSTDARFEAVLAPRRSLGTTTPGRIGLTADDLAHGETPEAALARFRAFWDAERDAQLVAWGPYPRDLLTAEGEPRRGFIDLRALAARALGRSPGGIDRCAADLGVDVKPALRGRAGRMLALLEGIYAALCDRAAVAPVEIA
jgi:hypothetical protein